MERVRVKSISVITPEDGGEEDRVESEFSGALRRNGGEILLTYTEDVEGGRVFHRILWREGTLTTDRRGAVTSQITFRVGETTESVLSVPPLSLPLSVTTREVILLPTPSGIGFRVVFDSSVGDGVRQRTSFTVLATPE